MQSLSCVLRAHWEPTRAHPTQLLSQQPTSQDGASLKPLKPNLVSADPQPISCFAQPSNLLHCRGMGTLSAKCEFVTPLLAQGSHTDFVTFWS